MKHIHGEMVIFKSKYHANCLSTLNRRASRVDENSISEGSDARLHVITFEELVAHLEDYHDKDICPHKLVDLANLYYTRLVQLGVSNDKWVHSTTRKVTLLVVFPDLTANSRGS